MEKRGTERYVKPWANSYPEDRASVLACVRVSFVCGRTETKQARRQPDSWLYAGIGQELPVEARAREFLLTTGRKTLVLNRKWCFHGRHGLDHAGHESGLH